MEHKETVNAPQLNQAVVDDGGEIDLVEIFYLFWGHAIQIILCAILGGLLAFGYTRFLVTPLYQAEAKLYMVSASAGSMISISDLQLGSQLTSDYQQLMVSRPLLEDVIDSLDLNMGYGALKGMISVSNPTDTRILRVTVTSSDPKLSCDIANELVDQAVVYLPRVMECDEPNIVERAVVPGGASSPNYASNVLLGVVAGILICCGIILIRFLMNDTFVTADDLARRFGTQPLASIPEADLGSFNKRLKHKK
ncbi:capsular polysaccharide biosynthesis protein [Pseudoflavonifractor capillosus]|uniref:YveK family protein n=1 Tax=Pseudoflavonifractor capillosus TaxID=106588 RepID=UPI00195E73E7|nr:Wzz/FepE/Etk N-terminal domain-containing protein [Pseudoflavonifractor capillosus]MBM6695209.1 capsular polysaccharide biosynthesis protein [Pseudoflavonifractor capillosus]